MGAKRSYEDVESASEGSDSGSESTSKRAKYQDKEGTLGRSKSKKRVHTIRKQLDHDEDLPADVRIELQRELTVHEMAIAEQAFRKKRAAMIAKYHMVRFFGKDGCRPCALLVIQKANLSPSPSPERKKAMRTAKRLKKRIGDATDPQEIKRLQKELHVAEVDEAYAQHFPHIETYISLYPKSQSKQNTSAKEEEEETSTATECVPKTEKPPMWTAIENALKEGPQALAKIREQKGPVDERETTGRRKTQKGNKSAMSIQGGGKAAAAESVPDTSDKYPPVRPPAITQTHKKEGKAPAMNRRERRKLMREMVKEEQNEGESFFE